MVLLLAALALTAMLLAACGGGDDRDDRAKVEASLRYYLRTLDPEACLDEFERWLAKREPVALTRRLR